MNPHILRLKAYAHLLGFMTDAHTRAGTTRPKAAELAATYLERNPGFVEALARVALQLGVDL